MEVSRLQRKSENEWYIAPYGKMRVPGVIFASESLIHDMDEKVYDQVTNVAKLPGIVKASYAMPDAHWGYGFPIGGVAAFDPEKGGVISAGGVGFDISCGVRTLLTVLTLDTDSAGKRAIGGCAVSQDSRGRRQHRRVKPEPERNGRDAPRRREVGGGTRLWQKRRSRAR